jgi:hypothetical protein
MIEAVADPASFRDGAGRVFRDGARIFRTVTAAAAADYEAFRASGLFDSLVADGRMIAAEPVDISALGPWAKDARYVLEHPRLPFISYPYEWSFPLLKAAALHHLELHRAALERGLTFSDGSAYNVQFIGVRPVFIDTLSFRRYRPGEVWGGYRQFCEQFLCPLLLTAWTGVPFNAVYRGRLAGMPVGELKRLLPWRAFLSRRVLTHIALHAALEGKASSTAAAGGINAAKLPKEALVRMLTGLRDWIATLAPKGAAASFWQDYEQTRSYRDSETASKHEFVRAFVAARRPEMLWDFGCNAGEFSALALASGASYVVGVDGDHGALATAYGRARDQSLRFTPLALDLTDPSPAQGWAQGERAGLAERGPADALLALALVHHFAIGRNVPLPRVLDWLMARAPSGVIEFVPKSDPQVVRMLSTRADIFPDYTLDAFIAAIAARGRIVRRQALSDGGRELVWYETP